MAFSADELRVLRRALTLALRPAPLPAPGSPERAEEVRELCRLAEDLDEAVREGGRLRAFLLADLTRYRSALPGSAPGYLAQLQDALAAGHVPGAEDLAALRSLCARSGARGAEGARRYALLHRCEVLAERAVRARLADRAAPALPAAPTPAPPPGVVPSAAPPRGARRLPALPRGRTGAAEPGRSPGPGRKPPAGPEGPGRPVPTPGEAFPPRKRPSPPPDAPPEPAERPEERPEERVRPRQRMAAG